MNTLTGVELDAAVASVLGKDHHLIQRCARMGLAFDPSHKMALAMELLIDLEMAVYRDPDAEPALTEPWLAGFNLRGEYDRDYYESMGPEPAYLVLDHGARGDTPQVAICRAIVQRAEDQVREDQVCEAVERAERAQQAIARADEYDRQVAIRAVAWDRANHARATRTAWTDFANDEERAAYALALDQQLENIRVRNRSTTGSAKPGFVALPLLSSTVTPPGEPL